MKLREKCFQNKIARYSFGFCKLLWLSLLSAQISKLVASISIKTSESSTFSVPAQRLVTEPDVEEARQKVWENEKKM